MLTDDFFDRSLKLHQQLRGKLEITPRVALDTRDMLSIAYTPGVARPCQVIAADPGQAIELTIKRNSVAVVTDGSAVLGLGNIGPLGAIPVMEGKAILFKAYANIDAFPICLDTQDTDEIVKTVRHIAPVFGGINLEDISAPRCFEVEQRLQDLGIPVFHDDQHGTAIVVAAALMNASRLLGRPLAKLKVVIHGAGAAGVAISRFLCCVDLPQWRHEAVQELIVCDKQGAIASCRSDLNSAKRELLSFTNPRDRRGSLKEVLLGADVFIGVSVGDILSADDIRRMSPNPIILALANPIPEIDPDIAREAGAAIVATGRSDFPNQVNNVLAFPGIFRGALDARAPSITAGMKFAAAMALAGATESISVERILPPATDRTVAYRVAEAVASAARGDCLKKVQGL